MSVNIPQNTIIINYTSGKEYLVLSTYEEYIGYYYEVSDTFFAGDKFNVNAPELVKIGSNRINKLKANPATSEYAKLSGIKIDNIEIKSIIYTGVDGIRYFAKKVNNNLIKEINKETFDQIQSNPLYQSVFLQYSSRTSFDDKEVEEANKIIVGIKEFLIDLNFNPDVDLDTYTENDLDIYIEDDLG
jgi:hypothetical protein